MTINTEHILLGAWLKGDHLTDAFLIREEMMAERDVFKMLKDGKNLLQIAEKLGRISEMVEWMRPENCNDYLYEPALDRLLTQQMYYLIQNKREPSEIIKAIENTKRTKPTDIEPCRNAGEMVMKEMGRRATTNNPFYKHLNSLNQLTNGIKRKELTVIAARPSVGKSAIGLQTALGVIEQGYSVAYFPLEMSAEQSYMRMMCQAQWLTSDEMRTGKPKDMAEFSRGIDWLQNLQRFDVYEGVNDLDDIIAITKRDKPYLVIIDQLSQLRASKQFGTLREQFSYMTSHLKAMALSEDVAVMLLCQINRSADNIEPMMSNLKESGSIEEDSDNVILLHRIEEDDSGMWHDRINWEIERLIQFNLAKQRDGATGKFYTKFYPNRFSFYEN